MAIVGFTATRSQKATQAQHAKHLKKEDIKWEQLEQTPWEVGRIINTGNQNPDEASQQDTDLNLNTNYCNLITPVQNTPGCTNALINIGANISLLQLGAPAQQADTQMANKSILLPKGTFLTTETLLLLLNKLPAQAWVAHRFPGVSNNFLAISKLVDAGCELFFHSTGCKVTYNGEIILRGWWGQTTQLWRVSLIPEGGNNIVPSFNNIDELFETTRHIKLTVFINPSTSLINFYYATVGYPIISTWCKAINKGYLQGKATWIKDKLIFALPSHHLPGGIHTTRSHDRAPTST
eukprot:CCRYP_018111-RA/>CCRYP_018111-RA protein AED:0.33 eAED:0.46 QI:0/0/0/1/0/0/4/0/293